MLPDTELTDLDNSPILKVTHSSDHPSSLVPKKFRAMARDASLDGPPRLAPTFSTPQFHLRPLSPMHTVRKTSPGKPDDLWQRSFLNELASRMERVEGRLDRLTHVEGRFDALRSSVDCLEGRVGQFEELSVSRAEVLNPRETSQKSSIIE